MKNIEELRDTLSKIEKEKTKEGITEKRLDLLEKQKIFMIEEYIVRKYILGQEHKSDDEDYVDDGHSSLKKEHNFKHPLPDEIYDLPKKELISIIKQAHNERQFEYEYKGY